MMYALKAMLVTGIAMIATMTYLKGRMKKRKTDFLKCGIVVLAKQAAKTATGMNYTPYVCKVQPAGTLVGSVATG